MRKLLFLLFLLPVAVRGDEASRELARLLLERTDPNRGVCSLLAIPDDLTMELLQQSDLLFHARMPDPDRVRQLRGLADDQGYSIQRLTVDHGSLHPLPYASNSIDLLICPSRPVKLRLDEIIRCLRPGGQCLLGQSENPLTAEEKDSPGMDAPQVWSHQNQSWIQFRKAELPGADEWTHWEKAPDNNPVSLDANIKAPYMTQYLAPPYYIGMPAITTVAGGRTFLAMGHIAHHEREWNMLNRLIARNGYNGTILWERDFPEGYLVHRSAFVASRDTFYMILGDQVLKLDARDGKEQGRIRIPQVDGDWKWIAIQDDLLYLLAGEPGPGTETVKGNRALGGWSWSDLSKGYYGDRIPHGFGDVLAAYHLDSEKVQWIHREDSLIDSRGLAIQGEQFFLYCPDRHLRALDRSDGSVLWTQADPVVLGLVEEPGKGLKSTPGWRTQSLIVATPETLVIQGQTRMNVIGISTGDGSMRWHQPKYTNNPNAIFVDGRIVLGVGERGSHVSLDPITGTVEKDLKFFKRACTRLTASPDSFFTRGEGMLRFDRKSGRVSIDGAVRPACNDGVIPANGLLYLGPWACDCNLSLIGNVARCSAGDFSFEVPADPTTQLHVPSGSDTIQEFSVAENDWQTYRGNVQRSAASPVSIGRALSPGWTHEPSFPHVPSETTTAAGLIFRGGDNGVVSALEAASGEERWRFISGGVVKYPPTLWKGRALFGSGDGHVYCLEASTGRLLWRFRAAPQERHIMVYGTLSSTWPVNTGVLVHEGMAYFAAGIVDHDGTYVYALDARSGEIQWSNPTSGHLNPNLRKGVSALGNLTLSGDELILAGGNVVSPARFDLQTGQCLNQPRPGGHPQNNGGKFVGVYPGNRILAGGRILYSSPRNVSTKGSFDIWSSDQRRQTFSYGGIPPAWNDSTLVTSNFKYGRITALDEAQLSKYVDEGFSGPADARNRFSNNVVSHLTKRGEERWQTSFGDSQGFEPVSLVLTADSVVAVARFQDFRRAVPQWFLTVLDPVTGDLTSQLELPDEPLPGGLAVDRDGRVLVSMINGSLAAFLPRRN